MPFLKSIDKPMMPYAFLKEEKKIRCLSPGPERFLDPFFYDTMLGCRYQQDQQIIDIPIDALPEVDGDVVPVKLLVFHVSRCGSTLLTQMLAQAERNIVLSEPMIVDELLRSNLPMAERKDAVRKCVNLLASPKTGKETYTVVKLDSWHIIYLDILKEVFDTAKVLFLFRDPEAIIRSHQKFRGRQMVPTVLDIELVKEPVEPHDLDGYAMRVLATFYSQMLEKHTQADVLLDYQLIAARFVEICRNAGMSFSAGETNIMLQRAEFHSKTPRQTFHGDEFLTGELDAIYLKKLNELYKQLLIKAESKMHKA